MKREVLSHNVAKQVLVEFRVKLYIWTMNYALGAKKSVITVSLSALAFSKRKV